MTVHRRYRMIRLGKGDYLLPGNDQRTLWRIRSYTDGPSMGLIDWPSDREVWMLERSLRSVEALTGADEQILDPDNWEHWSDTHPTRQAAIADALEAEQDDSITKGEPR